jgi:polyisoprenoid-binding protein YceI
MSTTAVEIPGHVAGTYTIDPSHSDVAFTVTRAGWRSQ